MPVSAPSAHDSSATAFMQRLRQDHAGLSRVLRAIDALAERLTSEPELVQPVLIEAFGYLLAYQHGYHHPREDRLFGKINGKRPALSETLEQLTEEHETGEHETAELAAALKTAAPDELRGRAGEQLAARIENYVRYARRHMRHEEAVFYARAESVLGHSDWAEIVEDDGLQDPMSDSDALAGSYPELAAHLDEAGRSLGSSDYRHSAERGLRRNFVELTDVYGGLIHDGLDLTRRNTQRLLSVRGPVSLAGALASITSDNLRFAGQCIARPSRWAIGTGADWLTGRGGSKTDPASS